MSLRHGSHPFAFFFMALMLWGGGASLAQFSPVASKKQLSGQFVADYWLVRNNINDISEINSGSGSGDSALEDRYQLTGLRSNFSYGFSPATSADRQSFLFNFDGRFFFNAQENANSFAFDDRYRYELRQFNLESRTWIPDGVVWLGRQQMHAYGGVRFDGLRLERRFSEAITLGTYGGLIQNPRNAVGFIGQGYTNDLFTLDFVGGGVYTRYRKSQFQVDSALHLELFEGDIDRFYYFGQGSWDLSDRHRIGGALQYAFNPQNLNYAQTYWRYRITSAWTNQLSMYHFRAIEYAASQASQISPENSGFTPLFFVNNDIFNDSRYFQVRNQTSFSVNRYEKIYGGAEWSYRSFDARDRQRVFLGYRRAQIAGQPLSAHVLGAWINSFRSKNLSVSASAAYDLFDGRSQLEAGFAFYAMDRLNFFNNDTTGRPRISENETQYFVNYLQSLGRNVFLYAAYNLYLETESLADDARFTTHDVYVATRFRF